MITENLSTLKIHKLTQAQYDRELAAGRIDENALYLTPDEVMNEGGYVTEDYVDNVVGSLDDLTTTDKTDLVSAINEVSSGVTVDSTQLNNMLEEVLV